jgi:hypothetical protein
MSRIILSALLSLILLSSCNRITTGSSLSSADIQHIEKLGLLGKGEAIVKFYSQYDNENAGNLVTDRRLASYWLDKDDTSKTKVSSAWYKDIKSIDTVYNAVATYCPYMKVTTNEGTTFKVCADGEKAEIKAFFEEALRRWKSE